MHTPEHPRPFHTTEEFLKIAGEFKSKTIGKLPKEFLTLFPEDPKKVFQFLDELSIFTRGYSWKTIFTKNEVIEPQNIKLTLQSGQKIKLNYLGEGNFSKAFKMDLPEKSYVFKSFIEVHKTNNHGATDEIKAGVNLSGESFKDLRKTHIGNFQNNHEWAILEYIDKSMSVDTREGKLLKKERPYISYTDERPSNRINRILIDMGGMKKKNDITPEHYYSIIEEFEEINTDIEREEKFYRILNSTNPLEKKGLGRIINNLDWNKSAKYFYDVLNDPHIESKLGLEMNFDILPDEIKLQAYNDWMKYLKSHLTLCEADI